MSGMGMLTQKSICGVMIEQVKERGELAKRGNDEDRYGV